MPDDCGMKKKKYLILSDMHFGTPESSINHSAYRGALIDHIVSRAPWEEIVFIGDLLDINLSTFTRSIEGGNYPDLNIQLVGFRQFISEIDACCRSKRGGRGLRELSCDWFYVPGNHDYKIWDMLSTKIVCEDVLSSGCKMGSVPTQFMRHKWTATESFFSGIFKDFDVQDQVTVEYPNHEIIFGDKGKTMVLTHGHYLDKQQTSFNDLSDRFSKANTLEEVKEVRREIFIATAQYQAAANAVSFTQRSRGIINAIFGPDGYGSKIERVKQGISDWILYRLFLFQKKDGKDLSQELINNIECYLKYFCENTNSPRWFIFGHTHRQGFKTVKEGLLNVYNAGSCYMDRGMPITFIEIEADSANMPTIQLMCVDREANVKCSFT